MRLIRFLAALLALVTASVAASQTPPIYRNSAGSPTEAAGTFGLSASGVASSNPTYTVAGTGYAAYATPTDLVCLTGSASKTVAVLNAYLGLNSTSPAPQNIFVIRRNTGNSGGTLTSPVPTPVDSGDAAATAVAKLYTAAPTLGNQAGVLRIAQVASGTATGASSYVGLNGTSLAFNVSSVSDMRRPVILRGAAESLCLNYNGAALTAGFTASYYLEWIEF